MTHEIVYVPQLSELHWYGCVHVLRRHAFVPVPQVEADEIDCEVCGPVMGSPSWE